MIGPRSPRSIPTVVGGPLADRLGYRVGLLVNLLEHERLIALLLGRLGVPVDLHHLALERLARGALELDPAGTHDHDLVVLDVLDPPGLPQEGGDGRGDELLPLSPADDQRAVLTRADQQAGLVERHGHERVVAPQLGVRAAYRRHQVTVIASGHQMGDHLGVGLRGEHGPAGDQLLLELEIVLDDPVDHDVHAVGGVVVRVGVLLGHRAVGGPPGVADPRPLLRALSQGHARGALAVGLDRAAQRAQVADRPHGVDPPVVEDRDAGAVVAAVLELLEPGQEQRACVPGSDVANDSAHGR